MRSRHDVSLIDNGAATIVIALARLYRHLAGEFAQVRFATANDSREQFWDAMGATVFGYGQHWDWWLVIIVVIVVGDGIHQLVDICFIRCF